MTSQSRTSTRSASTTVKRPGAVRPGYLAVAVALLAAQAVAGAVAAGVVLVAVEDAGPRFGIAACCLAVAALLALCATLLHRQRRRDWPRWTVITTEVAGLVVALMGIVSGQLGALAGAAACTAVLYALSDPEVIDWFGPTPADPAPPAAA